MKNKKIHTFQKICVKVTDESVSENELLWTVSSIILDELLKKKLKIRDVDTKNSLKN